MTGNELNYAFQQTVSSEYTFGSGDKLIDSFPSWPDMKVKNFFNPYNQVNISYATQSLNTLYTSSYTLITNGGVYTSFGVSGNTHTTVEVTLRVSARAEFIDGSIPFYYNDKQYKASDVLFDVVIHNVGDRNESLVFKGSDMRYNNIDWFAYDVITHILGDGQGRLLYYSPVDYMKLRTSNGDVTLHNSDSQLYTYI